MTNVIYNPNTRPASALPGVHGHRDRDRDSHLVRAVPLVRYVHARMEDAERVKVSTARGVSRFSPTAEISKLRSSWHGRSCIARSGFVSTGDGTNGLTSVRARSAGLGRRCRSPHARSRTSMLGARSVDASGRFTSPGAETRGRGVAWSGGVVTCRNAGPGGAVWESRSPNRLAPGPLTHHSPQML